jgi:hypothetical protein
MQCEFMDDISNVVCLARAYFFTPSIKQHDFQEQVAGYTVYFVLSLILYDFVKIAKRGVIINAYCCSCTVLDILVRF